MGSSCTSLNQGKKQKKNKPVSEPISREPHSKQSSSVPLNLPANSHKSHANINSIKSSASSSISQPVIRLDLRPGPPAARQPVQPVKPVQPIPQPKDPAEPADKVEPSLPGSRLIQANQDENRYLNRLTKFQISMLESKFKQHQSSPLGLDLASFKSLMPYISQLPPNIIENAFHEFCDPQTLHIQWLNFCKAVSVFVLGSTDEKCRFLYTIFENKQQKSLTKAEVGQLASYIQSTSNSLNFNSSLSASSIDSLLHTSDTLSYDLFRSWAFDHLDLHKALQPFEVIPSAATEKEFFRAEMSRLRKAGLQEGEFYYLIASAWLETWKAFVKYDVELDGEKSPRISYKLGSRPVAIQNHPLMDPKFEGKLKSGLRENEDFVVVSRKIWKDLHKWYEGGPEIRRQAVRLAGKVTLEVYLQHFQVDLELVGVKQVADVFASLNEQVSDLLLRFCQNGEELRTLQFFLKAGAKFQRFDLATAVKALPLGEVNLCKVKCLNLPEDGRVPAFRHDLCEGETIEYKNKGYWMLGSVEKLTSQDVVIKFSWNKKVFAVPHSSLSKLRKPKMTLVKDKLINSAVGLVNLGNTCYLNSILQSLFHTPLFKDFFSSENFRIALRASPYQSLIISLFELLIEYKTTHKDRIRPVSFYKELLKKTIEFEEGKENDCHELLLVLLSMIHEGLAEGELNMQMTLRLRDLSEVDEKKASKEQWKEYREVKGSIISAIFAGQTRNCFTCNCCGTKKVIFEIFNDLSVPIPKPRTVFMGYVKFVPRKTENIEKIAILLAPEDPFEKFLQIIEEKTQLKSSSLVFGFNRRGICLNLFQPLGLAELFKKKDQELCVFEVLTYLEEVEKLNKYFFVERSPANWREALKKMQLVDVLVQGKWEIAHVADLSPTKVKVRSHTNPHVSLTLEKTSQDLQVFSSQVRVSKRVLHIPVNHVKLAKVLPFGVPQVLSVGSWFTWHELLIELRATVYIYSKTIKSPENTKFFLYNLKKEACGICKGNCEGCEILDNYATVCNLEERVQDLFIRVFWVDSSCYSYTEPKVHSKLEQFHIHECFDKFSEKETIDLKCDNCGEKSQTSQIELWRLPDILVVHLKRFYNERNYLNKIDSLIKFPIKNLNMSTLMLNSKKNSGLCIKNSENNFFYDLFAVVNHNGSISSGHYTTYCLNEDEKWLFFDDDKTFLLNKEIEEEIVSNKAYILFYKRQRFRPSNILHSRDILNRV